MRRLTIKPTVKDATYISISQDDQVIYDGYVGGTAQWQIEHLATLANAWQVDEVDVNTTGVGAIYTHGLAERLDIPVLPTAGV